MSRYSRLYEVLKRPIIYPMIGGFYRRIQVSGYEKVPKEDGVIFAANHQNALIDALNVIYAVDEKRQTTFLTRSDVFNHRFKWIMLGLFKMLPIYRQRDNLPDMAERNAEIFQRCVDILSDKEVVLIFPEGNHDRTRRLRPLKKGIVRIGFQAATQTNFEQDIYVVPIGLNYTEHIKFHRDLYIQFGDPINLKDYYDLYQENESKALTESLKEIRSAMSKEILHIMNREHYPLIHGLQQMYAPALAVARGHHKNDLQAQLNAAQDIIASLEAKVEQEPETAQSLQEEYKEYEAGLKSLRLRDHTLSSGPHGLGKVLIQLLLLLAGLPLYLYGMLNNYLPYRISWHPARAFFKDDHFHSSITAIAAYFIFPIFYLIQFGIFWAVSGKLWMAGLYLLSLPLLGRFAIRYSEWAKKWWATVLYVRLDVKKDPKLARLRSIRTKLIQWAGSLVKEKV